MSGARRAPPRRPQRGDGRVVGLFLLGLVLFSPPLLQIFGREVDLFGWPLLYAYVFGAWAGLIILMALLAERRAGSRSGPNPDEDER